MNEEDSFRSFIPLLATGDELSHEGFDDSSQECHAFHQPVFCCVTNERILIVEEVEHTEESNLVELYKFFVDVEEVFVFVASQPPEM